MSERDFLDKLVHGTNLWAERKGEIIHVYYLEGMMTKPNTLILATSVMDKVVMFVMGFKACLKHANGLEFKGYD